MERECCPECRSQSFLARVGGIGRQIGPDRPRYRCDNCHHEFDEPDTREDGRRLPPCNGPVARALHEADPDTEIRPKGGSD